MRFGPFTLLQRIGGSGETERWLATRERPGGGAQRVVVKRLAEGCPWDAARAERLASDVEAAARLGHPSLVPLVDVGVVDGVPYVATAKLDGDALSDVVHTAGALPVDVAVGITLELAGVLGALQAQVEPDGTRDRLGNWDVRAEHVFLLRDGRVVLSELGTAALDGAPPTPEPGGKRRTGGTDDDRRDVLSLGALLHEMVTGEPPSPDGRSGAAAPGRRTSTVPPSLEPLLRRALASAPSDRHASPQAFRDALRAASGVDSLDEPNDRVQAWIQGRAVALGAPPGGGVSRSRRGDAPRADGRPGLRPWQMVLGILLVVAGWFALQWIAAPYDGSFIKDAAPPLNLVPLEPVAPAPPSTQPEPPTPWAPSQDSEASGDDRTLPVREGEIAAP